MLSARDALARLSLGVMILQLAFVPAQLHFQVNESLVERTMGVLAFAFRFENCT